MARRSELIASAVNAAEKRNAFLRLMAAAEEIKKSLSEGDQRALVSQERQLVREVYYWDKRLKQGR